MIVLGIDPGLATVGFGVIKYDGRKFYPLEYGAILTDAHTPVEGRLNEIFENISELCCTYSPSAASIEELFFNTNAKTAVNVCQARGVILLALTRCNIPVYEYTPLQIKQAVTGYGRAEKEQVMFMVKTLLKLPAPPRPDDTADAIAAAVCHAYSAASSLFGLK